MQLEYYDPRDTEQRPDDRHTWKPTRNPALILGNLMKHPSLWDVMDTKRVTELADYCEQMVSLEK